MPKQKTETIEGQVLRVTKRKAISGAWAHGVVIRNEQYSLFTDEEFFPVRVGDYVVFSFQTKRLKSGRRRTYYAIQPDSLRIQDANPVGELTAGYVYVLVNEAMPGMVKIGFTERTPTERARELSYSTGVPKPFEVAWSVRIQGDAELVERACHEELKTKRRGKEFFAISVAAAEKLVRRKYSEIYPQNVVRQEAAVKRRLEEFEVRRAAALAEMRATREREEYEASPEYKWKQSGYVNVVLREFDKIPKGARLDEFGGVSEYNDSRSFFQRLFNRSPGPDWLQIDILGRAGYTQKSQPPWRVIGTGFLRGKRLYFTTGDVSVGDKFTFFDAMSVADQFVSDSGVSNRRIYVEVACELLVNPTLLEGESLKERYGRLSVRRNDLASLRIYDSPE